MSQFFEMVFGWLLSAGAFFDNLKERRSDDPAMARYRELQRACLWSLVVPFVVLAVGLAVGYALNMVSDALRNPPALEDLRQFLINGVLGVAVISGLIAVYNCWRLWRFERGDDKFG
jgi:hypothetical protein